MAPMELCVDFLRKNSLWAKITENGQQFPSKGIFSIVLKLKSAIFD